MANALSIKGLMDTGKRRRGVSVLLYGPPKVGKTALAAQLAKDFRLWWFDIENGSEVLFNSKVLAPEYLANIELFSIPDYKGQALGIEYTMKAFKGEQLNLCDEHSVHNCPKCIVRSKTDKDFTHAVTTIKLHELDLDRDVVVLDSITQLTRSAGSLITTRQLKGEDSKFEYDHWRLQNTYVDIVMDMCQAGLFNTVCITHEQGIDQVDGSEKITPAASTKNYARTLAKNFDSVVYCYMNGTVHNFSGSTQDQPKAITGTRADVNIKRDGLRALFNAKFRTPDPDTTTAKKPVAGAQSTASKSALLSKLRK